MCKKTLPLPDKRKSPSYLITLLCHTFINKFTTLNFNTGIVQHRIIENIFLDAIRLFVQHTYNLNQDIRREALNSQPPMCTTKILFRTKTESVLLLKPKNMYRSWYLCDNRDI